MASSTGDVNNPGGDGANASSSNNAGGGGGGAGGPNGAGVSTTGGNGGNGDNNSGGAGGPAGNGANALGQNGTEWTQSSDGSHGGSGGGGGGANLSGGTGGNGGSYGAGAGGGARSSGNGGIGGDGVIVITYTPLTPTKILTESRYRWRMDNGSESGAAWQQAENTAGSATSTANVYRLRFEITNSGNTSTATQFQLQYQANATSGAWTTMPTTSTISSEIFEMASSTQFTDGAATPMQLTADAASSTPGQIEQSTSTIGSITLLSTNTTTTFTEVEYALRLAPADDSTDNGTYYFRLTNPATSSLDVYTQWASLSISLPIPSVIPNRPILNGPAPNSVVSSTGITYQMTATDLNSDNVQYKQVIYANEAGTEVVQTNDQSASQTGWSGQDASSSLAYKADNVSGTASTFTLQTPLTASTTYYWGASAKDPNGSGQFSSSSLTIKDPTWANTTGLPSSTINQSAATYNGYIYVTGGFDKNNTPTSTVSYAPINSDGTAGVWANTTALSSSTYDHSAVAYNGYLYTIGGIDKNSRSTTTVSYALINSNGTVGSWTNTTALASSTARHSAVAYNGYLYVTGGDTNSAGNNATTTVSYALINSNGTIGSWINTTAFPSAIEAHSAVAYNGYLYMVGGSPNGNNSGTSTVSYASLNSDGTVGTWTNTTVLPTGEFFHSTVVSNGYLYEMGGCDNDCSKVTSTVRYAPLNANGSVGTWTNTTALPNKTRQQSAVVSNGYIYMLAGENNSGSATSTVRYAQINEKGRVGDDGWRTDTALASSTFDHSAAVYNGYLYVTGGRDANNVATTTVSYAQLGANGTVGAWTNTTALASPMYWHSTVAYSGYLYITGGFNANGVATTTVSYAQINSDGTLGSWTNTSVLASSTAKHAAVAYNGYLYITGGSASTTSSGATTTVSYAQINANGTLGSWANTTALTSSTALHSAVAYNGYLYVTGGSGTGATNISTTTVSYAPINSDGTLGAWASTTNLPTARNRVSTVIYNGYLYVTGGSANVASNVVHYAAIGAPQTASGSLSSWLAATVLSRSLEDNSAIAYNGYLYSTGGTTSGVGFGATTTVYSAPLYTSLIPFTAVGGGAVATGTLAIKSHPCCQQINKFDIGGTNVTGTQLFNFQVSSTIENINITQLVFTLTNVNGFASTDVTSTELFIDYDADGTLSGGETTVFASGTTAIGGSVGTITFAGTLTVTSTLNLIMKANVTGIDRGDWFTMTLAPSGITSVGASSSVSITTTGSTISLAHYKPWRLGSSFPSDMTGGVPAAQVVGGGAPGGGSGCTDGCPPPPPPNQGGGNPGAGSGGSP